MRFKKNKYQLTPRAQYFNNISAVAESSSKLESQLDNDVVSSESEVVLYREEFESLNKSRKTIK